MWALSKIQEKGLSVSNPLAADLCPSEDLFASHISALSCPLDLAAVPTCTLILVELLNLKSLWTLDRHGAAEKKYVGDRFLPSLIGMHKTQTTLDMQKACSMLLQEAAKMQKCQVLVTSFQTCPLKCNGYTQKSQFVLFLHRYRNNKSSIVRSFGKLLQGLVVIQQSLTSYTARPKDASP